MAVSHLVNLLDGIGNLRHIETGLILIENVQLKQQIQQTPSSNVLHHQEQKIVILKGKLQLCDPGAL